MWAPEAPARLGQVQRHVMEDRLDAACRQCIDHPVAAGRARHLKSVQVGVVLPVGADNRSPDMSIFLQRGER